MGQNKGTTDRDERTKETNFQPRKRKRNEREEKNKEKAS